MFCCYLLKLKINHGLKIMENKVAHCPKCQKPVLTEAQFNAPVKFYMRCPSCQARLQVRVMVRVLTELITNDVVMKPENADSPRVISVQDESAAAFKFPLN